VLKGLRGTFHTDNGIQTPIPEIADAIQLSAETLSEAGVTVEDKRPPGIEETLELYTRLFNWDGRAWIRLLLERAGTPLDQTSLQFARSGASATSDDVLRLVDRWDQFRMGMLAFLRDYDVIIAPVHAYQAIPHGTSGERFAGFSYTMTYNLTGWPAAVVRVGTAQDGLPIGVQIVCKPWKEDVALAIAQYLQDALGGWQPPPL
jgi:amidase